MISTLLLVLTSATAMAQVAAPNAEVAALRIPALMIDQAQAPKIDGALDDVIWERAAVITDFYQSEPQPESAPSERTEVRILMDAEQLYVYIHAFDSEPDRLTVTTKERDGQLMSDDSFRLVLDPNLTRREGYYFQINPAGSQGEGLLQSNSFARNWNMIWSAAARRIADGWSAEMAIPFRGLSYDPTRTEWGLDLLRNVKRKGETMRWGKTPAGMRGQDISYEGTLTGISGMTQGKGLDVQVYGSLRVARDWISRNDTANGRPSATAYYKFNSGLTGLLTLNTDFSDAPLDSRQVNTTRFSLFEAETRAFFLEDSANFEFANPARFNGPPNNNGKAFFSRNIGLVRGRPVDIVAGGKVSGTAGGMTVGALSVRTANDDVAPAQTLSVLRLAKDILGESKLGMIYTNGDPTGLSRNSVAGIDFSYRNSSFRPDKRLLAGAFFERSASSTSGNDSAWGLSVAYPNQPWAIEARMQEVGADFAPALGFVNRPATRNYVGIGERVWRRNNAFLRRINLQDASEFTTGLDGRLQSAQDRLKLELQFTTTDEVVVGLKRVVEVLPVAFTLPGSITLPVRHYEWLRGQLEFKSATSRRVSVSLQLECCDYYLGRSADTQVGIAYHPNATFGLEFKQDLQVIRQPTGHTTIHIESLTAALNFTPAMQLNSEFQYDNVSHRLAASIRYKWQIRPATDLFAALGESATLIGNVTSGSYHSQGTAVVVRIGHRLQY
jgi:hypothetical protein